jgi:hypothetical protein
MVEITARTVGGRMLFRPTREMSDRVHGVIGRALSMFDVRLHAFTWMSNHAHYQASVRNAEQACGFISHVNRNTSLLAKRMHGWDGSVWGDSSIVPIVDDEASIQRFRYILANGVKEGLVESPLDWPGPNGLRALLDDEPIIATWRPLTRGGMSPEESVHPIVVSPLPCWENYPAQHRRRLLQALVHDIAEEGTRKRAGGPVLGVVALRRMDPLEIHELDDDERAAPTVHASSPSTRSAFMAARAEFIDSFRRAARLRRQQTPAPLYPSNGLPSLAENAALEVGPTR